MAQRRREPRRRRRGRRAARGRSASRWSRLAILVSTFGCVNGLILGGARVLFAMARDGVFFRAAGGRSRRQTPRGALVLQGAWSAVLALSGQLRPPAHVRDLRLARRSTRSRSSRSSSCVESAPPRLGRTAPGAIRSRRRCTSPVRSSSSSTSSRATPATPAPASDWSLSASPPTRGFTRPLRAGAHGIASRHQEVMANKTVHLPLAPLEPLGGTLRKDAWWAGPAATVLVLSGFIVYATLRAFEGNAYEWGAYLSPFYSPFFDVGWAQGLGPRRSSRRRCSSCPGPRASGSLATTTARPTTAPSRGTRRRAPSASARRTATTARRSSSSSRTCTATRCTWRVIFLVILWKDAIVGVFGWKDGVHVGVGTLVMLTNCVLLSGLHVRLPQLPAPHRRQREQLLDGRARQRAPPALEARHACSTSGTMLFAWVSLFSVALTDLYIRMVAQRRHHRRRGSSDDDGMSDDEVRDARARRARHRRRRRRAARGHRGERRGR